MPICQYALYTLTHNYTFILILYKINDDPNEVISITAIFKQGTTQRTNHVFLFIFFQTFFMHPLGAFWRFESNYTLVAHLHPGYLHNYAPSTFLRRYFMMLNTSGINDFRDLIISSFGFQKF